MTIVICIDAGHGGDFNGESHVYEGVSVYEKKYNAELANLIEEELRKYQNVEIVQTRREDANIGLKERTKYAVDHHADYLISIHNNSLDDPELTGSMVLVPSTHYQPENSRVPDIYEACNKMGLAIISKLQKLGIPMEKKSNHGLVRRVGQKSDKNLACYDDGSAADIFPTMRLGIEAGIPTIVLKHAYLSNEDDYKKYLLSWPSLTGIAKADAEGIAEALYLELKNKNPYNTD
ncbi:hypothetical protein M9Y10_003778 [Tritrichomonas musculus]|uniref:MurNAc-LAA domain-containing protein n=1 Tax=Tritrichomonas musculus TaxID=1915356 RepID=A0ABR2JQ87_9EUKA